MTLRTYLLALSLALCSLASAQVDVDNFVTVTELVEDILVGEGVTVENVTINGLPGNQVNVQAGSFTDPNSDIGIADGIIMGTGNVLMAEQPNQGGGSGLPGAGNGFNFPPLDSIIAPLSVNDQCIIEFDFVPLGDTLTFNYVFASEEYEEYVCGNVNDVFGFFLSGPDPAGGLYDNLNIALIPDPADPENYTNTAVSINTVNPGVTGDFGDAANCDAFDPNWADYNIFYTNNTSNNYEYDGNTVVLTARAIVECGSSYHIVLGIGDGGDTAFDSAVFLESGSFASEPSGLTAESLFPQGLVEISSVCDTGFATIRRPCAADTVYYQLALIDSDSAATSGVDFEPLPTELLLTPGQLSVNIPLLTIPDGEEESIEYICIALSESSNIDGPYTALDTACIPIIDQYQFVVTANSVDVYCPEVEPNLLAEAQDPGFGPFDVAWVVEGDTVWDEAYFETVYPPNRGDTTFFDIMVTDFCGATNFPAQTYIANLIQDDPEISITQEGGFCPGIPYVLGVERSGGTSPLTYEWSNAEGFPAPSDSSQLVISPDIGPVYEYDEDDDVYEFETERTYFVTVTDACNPGRSATNEVVVEFPPPLQVDLVMDTIICVEEDLNLLVTAEGGYESFSYDYGVSNPLDIEVGVTSTGTNAGAVANGFLYDPVLEENNDYVVAVQVKDMCATQVFSNDPIEPNYLDLSDVDVSDFIDDGRFETVEGVLSTVVPSSSTYFAYYFNSIDLMLTSSLNCIVPNVITPNGDGMNDRFEALEVINKGGNIYIYNRWGNEIASTRNYFVELEDYPAGTYFYVVDFADGDVKKGSFTILD